jgi:hypothetical protein
MRRQARKAKSELARRRLYNASLRVITIELHPYDGKMRKIRVRAAARLSVTSNGSGLQKKPMGSKTASYVRSILGISGCFGLDLQF